MHVFMLIDKETMMFPEFNVYGWIFLFFFIKLCNAGRRHSSCKLILTNQYMITQATFKRLFYERKH